jgi:hypothetical protein
MGGIAPREVAMLETMFQANIELAPRMRSA